MQIVAISSIKPNPSNPRLIKDDKFHKLVQSLKDFPEMASVRPIVVNQDMVILGGNMRFKAMKEAKWKEIPVEVVDWDEAKQREFIIKDNVGFGEWDWDNLANEYMPEELSEWGLDVPGFDEPDPDGFEEKEKPQWIPDCLFPSDNEFDIPTLLPLHPVSMLDIPFTPYGFQSRDNSNVGTYHFYVDDYRFDAIWDDPYKLIKSGCKAIVEPNLSLFNETPKSYGLFLIYKKRWIARFLQANEIKVLVDLNVSKKFRDLNQLGIPKGYNAFATRAYANRMDDLEAEYEVAKTISGLDNPFMVVYGGGKQVHKFCQEKNLIWHDNIMTLKNG